MDTSAEPSVVEPWIELRVEPQPPDDTHFVIRFEDSHVNVLIKRAMNNRRLYEPILQELEIPGDGALTVSSFALRDGWTLADISSQFGYSHYHDVTMRELRQNHLVVWPTTCWMATGDPAPCSEVHYDVVVSTDSGDIPGALLEEGHAPAARRAARTALADLFAPVLEIWNGPLEISANS